MSSDLTESVTQAWEAILGAGSAVDPTIGFFALGGDSLRIVEFWTAVEAIHPGDIDVDRFFESPTLATMLALIAADGTEDHGCAASEGAAATTDLGGGMLEWLTGWPGERLTRSGLAVSFNAHGRGGPPLVLICQGGEEAESFARWLGPDRPLHVFRSAIHVKDCDGSKLRALARLYLDDIEALYPTGPVRLVGFCQGGLIAKEIAVAIRERGGDAPFLALLEWHFGALEYPGPLTLLYASEGSFARYYKHAFLLNGTSPAAVDVFVVRAGHNLLNDGRHTVAVLAEQVRRFSGEPPRPPGDRADGADRARGDPMTMATDDVAACLAAGTLVRAVRGGVTGEVPVEALAVDDLVVTASGMRRPVRSIKDRSATWPPSRQRDGAIRIAAQAVGPGVPSRDLWVSPDQAIGVGADLLVPAGALVNGGSFGEEVPEGRAFWQVQLDAPDCLLAEGLACECGVLGDARPFIVDGDGAAAEGVLDVSAAARRHAASPSAFHDHGPVLDEVRARLLVQAQAAGWTLGGDALGDIHLLVDGARVDGDILDLTAAFVVPAAAADVRLICRSAIPNDMGVNADWRRLGACLLGLRIDGEFGFHRAIGPGDPRLGPGFHDHEEGVPRWTTGDAVLPPALWDGCRGPVRVSVDLAMACLPEWIMPPARPASGRRHAPSSRSHPEPRPVGTLVRRAWPTSG